METAARWRCGVLEVVYAHRVDGGFGVGAVPMVARADVEVLFQGTPDPEYCFSLQQCPATQTVEILLSTPIAPVLSDVESGPNLFVVIPKYKTRISYGGLYALFTQGPGFGYIEFDPPDFVSAPFQLGFDAPNGFFTGPDTAPVLIPGVYTGASTYDSETQGEYNGTVTILEVGATTATPEPGTWGLVGTGLLGGVGVVWRRLLGAA